VRRARWPRKRGGKFACRFSVGSQALMPGFDRVSVECLLAAQRQSAEPQEECFGSRKKNCVYRLGIAPASNLRFSPFDVVRLNPGKKIGGAVTVG